MLKQQGFINEFGEESGDKMGASEYIAIVTFADGTVEEIPVGLKYSFDAAFEFLKTKFLEENNRPAKSITLEILR